MEKNPIVKKENIKDINFRSIVEAQIRATAISDEIATFRIDHIKRVAEIATSLCNIGEKTLDTFKLLTAIHVHDMYKYVNKENHGKLAAGYLFNFIDQYPLSESEKKEWRKVCKAIAGHSERPAKKGNKYAIILYQADKLDKLSVNYILEYSRIWNYTIEEAVKKMINKVYKIQSFDIAYEVVRANLTKSAISLISDESKRNELSMLVENLKKEMQENN